MKKRVITVLIFIALGTFAITSVYAITKLIAVKSKGSEFKKAVIFNFDLYDGFMPSELEPGQTVSVCPKIYCDSTENMYAFIKISMATFNSGEPIYSYILNEGWKLIEHTTGTYRDEYVYAYAEGDELTMLIPGDETTTLMDSIKLKPMSTPTFAFLSDINILLTGCVIKAEDAGSDPIETWEICKKYGVGL